MQANSSQANASGDEEEDDSAFPPPSPQLSQNSQPSEEAEDLQSQLREYRQLKMAAGSRKRRRLSTEEDELSSGPEA